MRFRLVCGMAAAFPSSIVTAASAQSTGCQRLARSGKPTKRTRIAAANAAAFTAADMNAVTGTGAPW